MPLYVVDRSADIDQAEADLRRTLFAIVGGARPVVTPQQVRQAVVSTFNVDDDALTLAATEPKDFINFLPGSATTDRVFNVGAPLHALGFSVFFRRWTRVVHGQATVLPAFVELELHGIPAHAWSKSIAQQLLGRSC
jgi:hypothetical protein